MADWQSPCGRGINGTHMEKHLNAIRTHLSKPIVLVGLMGAGKTKIGGFMARKLDIPFVDADAEIETAAGRSIADIFEEQGEAAFRDLERRVIARLLSDEIKVIAPGGGAMMNEQTAALIKSASLSVWLKADLDILVERTGRTNKRPLLRDGDPREILQALMDKRYPVYAQADLTVESLALDAEQNAERVLSALADHLEKAK